MRSKIDTRPSILFGMLFRALLVLPLFAATTAVAAPPADSVTAAVLGKPAPDFSLPDTSGALRSLGEFKGKFIVLEWINHECPFVKKHYGSGNMQKLQKDYTAKGVVWLSINSAALGKQGHTTGEEADKLTQEKDAAPTALLIDTLGSVGKLYGAKTTPHIFIIDKEGVLRYAGAIDSIPSADKADIGIAQNYVSTALDQLMSGKDVHPSSTVPYGCSVKY